MSYNLQGPPIPRPTVESLHIVGLQQFVNQVADILNALVNAGVLVPGGPGGSSWSTSLYINEPIIGGTGNAVLYALPSSQVILGQDPTAFAYLGGGVLYAASAVEFGGTAPASANSAVAIVNGTSSGQGLAYTSTPDSSIAGHIFEITNTSTATAIMQVQGESTGLVPIFQLISSLATVLFSCDGAGNVLIENGGTLTSKGTNATQLVVGASTTNPQLTVDCSTASAATGLKIKGQAAGGAVLLSATSSAANESVHLDALGTGSVVIGGAVTTPGEIRIGNSSAAQVLVTGTTLNVVDTNAAAFTVGRTSGFSAFKVATNTANSATGVLVTAKAAASGAAISAISSGGNENLTIDALGGGTITLGGTSTGNIVLNRATTVSSTLATAFSVGVTTSDFAFKVLPAVSEVNGVEVQGALTNNQPIIQGAGTDTNVTLKLLGQGTGGVNVQGTGTNSTGPAGFVGEYVNSLVASGSAVSLSNGVAANVTSIALTAGDWDVEGSINFALAAATVTQTLGATNTTSATNPADGSEINSGLQSTVATLTDGVAIARKRVSLSSSGTAYLVALCAFSAGSVTAYGQINARRVR